VASAQAAGVTAVQLAAEGPQTAAPQWTLGPRCAVLSVADGLLTVTVVWAQVAHQPLWSRSLLCGTPAAASGRLPGVAVRPAIQAVQEQEAALVKQQHLQ
jgi:hypothetical protein